MESLSAYLPIVGVILVIVSTLAFIYAYYTMNLSKAQIAALRGDRDDQTARIKRLEDLIAEYEKRRESDLIEKQELKTLVTTLQGLVTHDTKINELIIKLDAHDTKVENKYTEYMESNREILNRIDRLLVIQERRNGAG
jgi:hypothetical protein